MSGPEDKGMNKTYRSIWNPSLGCYVAAPECAVAHAAGTSSKRVARATPLMRSKSVLALESRALFDGAMLATAIEQDSAPPAPEIPEVEIEEPVEAAATEESTEAATATAADADVFPILCVVALLGGHQFDGCAESAECVADSWASNLYTLLPFTYRGFLVDQLYADYSSYCFYANCQGEMR